MSIRTTQGFIIDVDVDNISMFVMCGSLELWPSMQNGRSGGGLFLFLFEATDCVQDIHHCRDLGYTSQLACGYIHSAYTLVFSSSDISRIINYTSL